jgi:hypothetical protein
MVITTTDGLHHACIALASPLNKLYLVRLGRKVKKIDSLRQATDGLDLVCQNPIPEYHTEILVTG